MNYLNGENLTKSYSEKNLFEGLNISLQKNQKMALIAANGTGKSTLLKILAGRETTDMGTVSIRNSITIGYLEQDPGLNPSATVLDSIFDSSSPELMALGKYERLIKDPHHDETELQQVIDKIDALGAWDHESKAAEILSKLGITDLAQTISALSGGQKKRVALARLLVEEPDLLLLDEPTNHLDLEMIEWLENYLHHLNKTLLMISHDRYFIERVCDTIAELDQNQIHLYKGNYAYYLEKKAEREFRENREIDKAQNLLRTELEWMRRQPQARTTKQKARIDSFYDLEEKATKTRNDERIRITMQMSRMGSKILELENVCKSYGEKLLFNNFSHVFKRGEKVGLLGKNGSGKSTLLKMIMGQVKPDQGRIKTGETMVFGYYSQDGLQLPGDKRVIDVVRDIAEYVETGNGNYLNVARFLEHFRFRGSQQHALVSKLSGGEKRRLYLLTILLKNPNFLILDEPTNDLDIVTLNILEEFLQDYEGCLLLVTHDRYFMDKLVDHVFVIGDRGIVRDIHSNYTGYRVQSGDDDGTSVTAETAPTTTVGKPKVITKLSYREEQELAGLNNEIEKIEKRQMELTQLLSSGEMGSDELQNLSEEYGSNVTRLESAMERWMELTEKQDQFGK
jgi:ABC transport system ATP-binding/permease protein